VIGPVRLWAVTRYAVAVWPPSRVVEVVQALDRPEVPGVHWSTPEQWMIKVRPLGHVPDRVVPPLIEVLESELDGAPTTPCTLGPATERLGGQWLGVPVDGLDDLAAVVFEVTEPLVPVTHPQPFRADLVLARGKVPKELGGLPLQAEFTVEQVALVADRSAPGRRRFDDVATFRLTGTSPAA
jgi:2'-5' RNA ligase